MTDPDQRDLLRRRIESATERHALRELADQARGAGDRAKDFVRAHPLATVAGVALLGLALGAMTSRGHRAGRAAGSRASRLLGHAVELGLAYAATALDQAGEAARKGQSRVQGLSDALSDNARSLTREARHKAGEAQGFARTVTRELSRQASRAMRDLKGRAGR